MFLASHMLLRGYGATAARLTPDQKVGSSNLSVLTIALAATPNPAQTEDD
jgi:hypothetical protein